MFVICRDELADKDYIELNPLLQGKFIKVKVLAVDYESVSKPYISYLSIRSIREFIQSKCQNTGDDIVDIVIKHGKVITVKETLDYICENK